MSMHVPASQVSCAISVQRSARRFTRPSHARASECDFCDFPGQAAEGKGRRMVRRYREHWEHSRGGQGRGRHGSESRPAPAKAGVEAVVRCTNAARPAFALSSRCFGDARRYSSCPRQDCLTRRRRRYARALNLYPTAGSLMMTVGCAGSSSSFCRRPRIATRR